MYLEVWKHHLDNESQCERDIDDYEAYQLDQIQQNMLHEAGDDQIDYDPFGFNDQDDDPGETNP